MDDNNMNSFENDNEVFMGNQHIALSKMVIGSVDTLRGIKIDQRIPPEWNCEPPLLIKVPKPTKTITPRAIIQQIRPNRNQQQNQSNNNSGHNSIDDAEKLMMDTKEYGTPEEQERLLKGMIRLGIPVPLRCAVWLSNIIQAVQPHQDMMYWLEYRTLAKIRALDTAYEYVLKQIMPTGNNNENNINITKSSSDISTSATATTILQQPQELYLLLSSTSSWDTMEASNLGRNEPFIVIDGTTQTGRIAHKRVLICLERILGIDYAPLIPSLTTILLTTMSESYTFCAIREMSHQSTGWYFSISQTEHTAWCYAFGDILRKLHTATAQYLEDRGVLDVNGLNPIFCDCFISIMPIQYVQRIIDIYTYEGSKVLYRFGIALVVLYRIESAENLITISNANEWWNTLKQWTYSKRFHFDLLVRKAYGVHGRGIRRQMNFPRRRIIQRIIRLEEENLKANMDEENNNNTNDINNEYDDDNEQFIRPLGLIHHELKPIKGNNERIIPKPIFAESHNVRLHLAKWLPITLRQTNLELLYSTNTDGRTLERFYNHVSNSKHTITICEVLQSNNPNDQKVIFGMYASQAWRVSNKVYGDGSVFLFRLEPNAICWKWKPERPNNGGNVMDQVDLEDDNTNFMSTNNQTALLEQFMVSTNTFISMGGNNDGSCGLRINEDLTKGESSTACGYNNEPLHGINNSSVFDIGLLEVYGFVRQIDGRAL